MALCPQRQDFNVSIIDQLGLKFPVLQDFDNAVATQFGLTLETPPDVIAAEQSLGLDLPAQNGNSNWDLPMPARFVIDQNRTIEYASCNADHRKRSDPAECLARLKDRINSPR